MTRRKQSKFLAQQTYLAPFPSLQAYLSLLSWGDAWMMEGAGQLLPYQVFARLAFF